MTKISCLEYLQIWNNIMKYACLLFSFGSYFYFWNFYEHAKIFWNMYILRLLRLTDSSFVLFLSTSHSGLSLRVIDLSKFLFMRIQEFPDTCLLFSVFIYHAGHQWLIWVFPRRRDVSKLVSRGEGRREIRKLVRGCVVQSEKQ